MRDIRRHHVTLADLNAAATVGCYICQHLQDSAIARTSQERGHPFKLISYLTPVVEEYGTPAGGHLRGYLPEWRKLTIEKSSSESGDSRTGAVRPMHETSDHTLGLWEFLVIPAVGTFDPTPDFRHGIDPIPSDTMRYLEVAENVGDRELPLDPFHDDGLAIAREWFQHCTNQCYPEWLRHRCGDHQNAAFRPTRLLDIASASAHGFVTPIDGHDLGQHETYSAVSHVWGKPKRLKLLADNIDELRRGIQVSDLPVSYKEALLVAEQLGLRYLWIDSLCIMQDSPSDWLREAGMMKDVYRNSHLTIGLAGATEHSEASFSQRSGSRIRLPSIETSWAGETAADMYIVKQDFREDYVGSTLSSRAWIYQELYLSPRILLLGREQLWYWCTEGMASETFPGWEPTAIAGLNQGTGAMKHPARDAPPVIQHQEWERNVEKYSRCALTYEADRMIAISGIASNFQARLHDDYVAGLWRSQLPEQLMWQTTGLGSTRKPEAYRAPSWSWASIEGPVVSKNRPHGVQALRTLCVVEEVAITLKDSADPTGLVLNGSLTLRGTLHPVLPLVDSEENQCLAHYDAAAGQMFVPERSKAVCDCFSIGQRGDSWRSDLCDGFDGFVSESLGRDPAGPGARTRECADMMGAYCLPLLACDDHGFPFRSGLLLQRSEEEPGTYRRVGVFRAIGIEEAGMFPADQQSLIRLI